MGVALPGSQRACSVQTVFRSLNRHSSELGACYVSRRTKCYFSCPLNFDRTQPVSEKSLTSGMMSYLATWHLKHCVKNSFLKLGSDSWIFEFGIC